MRDKYIDTGIKAVLVIVASLPIGYLLEPQVCGENTPGLLSYILQSTEQQPPVATTKKKVAPTTVTRRITTRKPRSIQRPAAAEEENTDDDDDGGITDDNEPDTTTIADRRSGEDEGKDKNTESEDDEEPADEGELVDIKKAKASFHDEGDIDKPVQEEHFKGQLSVSSWNSPKSLKQQLTSRIRIALTKTGINNISAFLADPANRLMLAQWQLLQSADMDGLAKLMHNRKAAESLTPLLNDLPWVSAFVYDGELKNADVALNMIYNMRQADPSMDGTMVESGSGVANPYMKRYIAAAVATEYARHNWYDLPVEKEGESPHSRRLAKLVGQYADGLAAERTARRRKGKKEAADPYKFARERYLFYASAWDEELLNSKFATTPNWLLRFICGWEGCSDYGTPTTMKWLIDNVSLPAEQYLSAHIKVDYLPTNIYTATLTGGTPAHMPSYYEPFDMLYPDNKAKEVRDIGGVCVQLSHFGAAAACANGIPALTMGEPGHCSYTVYHDGKWVPCNSFSETRTLASQYWDFETFTDLELLTKMYTQGQRTRDAQLICTLASVHHELRSDKNARLLYELAQVMQPLYLPLWNQYLSTMARTLRNKSDKALEINNFICEHLAPEHPQLCARYLEENIYPILLKSIRKPNDRLAAFLAYITNLKTNEKKDWDIDTILNLQYDALKSSTQHRQRYLEAICDHVQQNPDFVPALGWAISKVFMENRGLSNKYLKMVDEVIAKLSPDDPDEAIQRMAVQSAVIRAAEDMRVAMLSDPHFKGPRPEFCVELISKYSSDYRPADDDDQSKLPPFKSPSGHLISPGSIVMLSSYSKDRLQFASHASALTTDGGSISSEVGRNHQLTIELPKVSTIGRIVIIPTNGCSSYAEWFIETSTDGKKWDLLQKLPNELNEPSITIDIKHNFPRAKFVRIDSGGGIFMPGINFKAVLIYDNRKSAK